MDPFCFTHNALLCQNGVVLHVLSGYLEEQVLDWIQAEYGPWCILMPEMRMKPVLVSCQRACKLEVTSVKEEPKRQEDDIIMIYSIRLQSLWNACYCSKIMQNLCSRISSMKLSVGPLSPYCIPMSQQLHCRRPSMILHDHMQVLYAEVGAWSGSIGSSQIYWKFSKNKQLAHCPPQGDRITLDVEMLAFPALADTVDATLVGVDVIELPHVADVAWQIGRKGVSNRCGSCVRPWCCATLYC